VQAFLSLAIRSDSPMPTPDENLVRSVLSKNNRDKLIRSAVAGAWATFLEDYPERAWWRRKSTRAAVVWEHSVENAVQALDADSGAKAVPHDDTVSFVFDQLVLVRFKKADLELKSSNVPTLLASLFHAHDAEIPGLEDLQRVEAAYVLNQFQTQIDWIGIVARDRKRSLWHYELEGRGSVERLPLPDRQGTAADQVMRPKLTPETKREDKGE